MVNVKTPGSNNTARSIMNTIRNFAYFSGGQLLLEFL
jgi:hypothetical protein